MSLELCFYGGKTWTTYVRQENHLKSFQRRCLRRILGITRRDKVTNTAMLEQAYSPLSTPSSMTELRTSNEWRLYTKRYRVRWAGHGNVCKRYLKLRGIDSGKWEQLADDCSGWCYAVQGRDTKVGKRQNQLLVIRIPRRNKGDHSIFQLHLLHSAEECHAKTGLLSHCKTVLAKEQRMTN